MDKKLSEIKAAILANIELSNEDWITANIYINFPPGINRSLRMSQIVKDKNGENIRLIRLTEDLQYLICIFIVKYNQSNNYNQIVFTAKRDQLGASEIFAHFSEEVNTMFIETLPKSMRGKTVPWWKNPAETRDYFHQSSEQVAQSSTEPPESFALSFLKEHLSRLPVQEAPLGEEALSGKTLPVLYRLFMPYLKDEANPLWDGGLISISKDGSDQFSGKLIGYYYGSEEDRDAGGSRYDELTLPAVTEKMKSIYEAVQSVIRLRNPDMVWDTLIVSLYSDGFIEANYERDGEEVELE